MQEYEKYQELLNQKHKMEEQFQSKGNGSNWHIPPDHVTGT